MAQWRSPDITVTLEEYADCKSVFKKKFGNLPDQTFHVGKVSLDVRGNHPRYHVRFDVDDGENEKFAAVFRKKNFEVLQALPTLPTARKKLKVAVIGMGPSGLFAALTLARAGCNVEIYEKGKAVEERSRDVASLFFKGELNENSNICFGEGGAGTYSDGKLMCRNRHVLLPLVLQIFADHGATPDIKAMSKPHIGTDKLVPILRSVRKELLDRGAVIRFDSEVEDFVVEKGKCRGIVCNGDRHFYDATILAVGHSAEKIVRKLFSLGCAMESKDLAVGFRIEHPQTLINQIRYGKHAEHPLLPPAEYAFAVHPDNLPSVFSFCMCPGGRIVPSMTEHGTVAVNGMSSSRRAGSKANAAVVAQLSREYFGSSPLGGYDFLRAIETKAAKNLSPCHAPAEKLGDYLAFSKKLPDISSSYAPGVSACDLHGILPPELDRAITAAFPLIEKSMRGYTNGEAVLVGVESRTSSPVRILRSDNLQSVSFENLYPTGEGAGYAGGITSSAIDGIRVAYAVLGYSV